MSGPPVDVDRVADLTIPGPRGPIPARLYRPAEAAGRPVLVYFHGGGFVLGDLETHDPVLRALAAASGCAAVAVDYRLAPEHRFPAGIEDCLAAVDWVRANAETVGGDVARLAVAGDSAGGALAAVVAQERRDGIALQVLVYPNIDFAPDRDYASYRGPHVLPHWRARMDVYPALYLPPGGDPRDPRVSPLFARDLSRLPAALIVTADADPLRDEAALYAQRLIAAGNVVGYRPFRGQIHGFLQMAGMIDDARAALDLIAAAVRAA